MGCYICRLKEQPTIVRTLDKDVCLDLSSIAVDEVQHSPYQRDDKMSRDDPKAILCEENLPALVQYPIREMKFFTLITCIQIKQIYPPCIYLPQRKARKLYFPCLDRKLN